jgi:hypothetical protein
MVAYTPAGAPGTVAVAGLTLLEETDCGPTPNPFSAATVKVYATPLERPVTVALVASAAAVTLIASGAEVTT